MGAFAEAARARETQLSARLAASAAADRELEAVLHGAVQFNRNSRQRLDAIEAEIKQAASTWPGLDTPAGARQFQSFLIDKTRDIEKVVADGVTDSRDRAARVQALTGRYPIGKDLPADLPDDDGMQRIGGGEYTLPDGPAPPGRFGFPNDPNIPPPPDSLPGGGRWRIGGEGYLGGPDGGPPTDSPTKGEPWKSQPGELPIQQGRGSGWETIGTVPPNGWGEDPVVVGKESYGFRWVGESFNPDAAGHVQWVKQGDSWYRAEWLDYRFEQEHRRMIGDPGVAVQPNSGANVWKPVSIQDVYKIHNSNPRITINLPDLCGQEFTIPPRS